MEVIDGPAGDRRESPGPLQAKGSSGLSRSFSRLPCDVSYAPSTEMSVLGSVGVWLEVMGGLARPSISSFAFTSYSTQTHVFLEASDQYPSDFPSDASGEVESPCLDCNKLRYHWC